MTARLRGVELLPSDFPVYPSAKDSNYLSTEPGLFPDLLRPLKNSEWSFPEGQYRALWVDFPQLKNAIPGEYTVSVIARASEEITLGNGRRIVNPNSSEQVYKSTFTLRVLAARLPEQTLLHTEWLYADCLATYYGVEVFSKKHWQIIENFIQLAGEELGVNMLLTPVFTPPLDTAIGQERPTVQLVDIEKTTDGYRFSFDKLTRWCALCKRHGIAHIEVAHLFTQWGAKATPKIIATVNGQKQQIFGWDVPAQSKEYRTFLSSFLPALQTALNSCGYDRQHVCYHISDEPQEIDQEGYRAAKEQVSDLLNGCTIRDALSNYAYYKNGLVDKPIPSNDCIDPFIAQQVPDLWVYYCCGQTIDVPNRFYSMPSARNRIMGVLMYLYGIKGFLHWGYNFYYSQFSLRAIDPYSNTHADYAFPSGDAYLVYPGSDGQPLASIRSQVQRNALDDLASLQLLETLVGRDSVLRLIYENTDGTFTFRHYPTSPEYLLTLHETVESEIEQALLQRESKTRGK